MGMEVRRFVGLEYLVLYMALQRRHSFSHISRNQLFSDWYRGPA